MKKTSLDVVFDKTIKLDARLLKDFQGDLKTLSTDNYQKLRKQLEAEGFAEPVTAFELNGDYYLLNGHQRVRTLQMMMSEGVSVPNIPVNLVTVRDRKHAKRLVLGLTSQYGEISADGLSNFCIDAEIGMDWITEHVRFPEVDLDKWNSELPEVSFEPGTLDDQGKLDELSPVMCICPNCGEKFNARETQVKD